MPKSLGLKKPQPQVAKSQKAITQFFKATPCVKPKSTTSTETVLENKSTKRKATSPIQSVSKTSPVKENINGNQTKKCRIQHNTLEISNCKTDESQQSLKSFEVDNDFQRNKSRSPLSLINHENQDDKDCLLQTDVKLCNNINGKLLKSPEKLSSKEQNTTSYESKELSHRRTLDSKYDQGVLSNASPFENNSTVKVGKCDDKNENIEDLFGDEWDIQEIDEDCREDLDIDKVQRCEVLSVKYHSEKVELRLKDSNDKRCTCFVEGVWMNTPLQAGEIVSVLASRNNMGQFSINNSYGLLSLRPDHLISTTSVVAGVFCKRKAILQERWKGIDSANIAMTIGILIHELVQKALTQHITAVPELRLTCENIIKESLNMLYDAGISEIEAQTNMEQYITPLAEFMETYASKNQTSANGKAKWNGHIDKVLDIEENICCPQLGLKGKIDATLQVTIHDRKGKKCKEIVPLELKSGRASGSAEHRGQLVLYGMMLSLQREEDPLLSLQRGLLLYLKEQVDVREVSCGYPERRDLVMLRNDLVQHLAAPPNAVNTEEIVDIEEASKSLQQSLPEPVHHEGACSKCPYLTLCSIHLWHTNDVTVSETHPLVKLRDIAIGHLTSTQVKYFLHWTTLLKMEENAQMSASPLHSLWTDSPEKREKRGTCAANLKLKYVKGIEDRFEHVFERNDKGNGDITSKGPKEGEFSIVSLDNRPWVAAGVITLANQNEIHIILERNLSARNSKTTSFHIDTYESYATTVQNLTNLGVLMEDSDRALRLRKLVIDKEAPEFIEKLPREVGRLGSKLMRGLNIEQQRAVLKALSAQDYVLLQGLPGTGKTQTVSVLIQMLVSLKHRVLVTAHTHSAVDTVLTRLPDNLRVMRLGSSSRVASNLISKTEGALTKDCKTAEELTKIYDSMDVVGVTCLGANHALLSRTEFDVCIVDEATQVLQCTVLRPLFAAKRFVLVGDPEQLPPVVKSKSARRLGMEESLFHRLMNDKSTCTLGLQYRMNQALVDIANKVAYRDRLKCANNTIAQATMAVDEKKLPLLPNESWLRTACSRDVEDAALFLNVAPTEDSKQKSLINIDEANVVFALAKAFIQIGVKNSDIGVIAPYRDQVGFLREVLSPLRVEASTVDQFQGRDKSVILYSCTKRESQDAVKEGEIINDQRRLAVSVTRAKHKFIAIGHENALRKYSSISKLIDACKIINLGKHTLLQIKNERKSQT